MSARALQSRKMPKARSEQLKLTPHPYSACRTIVIEPRITLLNYNLLTVEFNSTAIAQTAKTILSKKTLWVNYDTLIKERITLEISTRENKLLIEFHSLTNSATLKQHFDLIFAQTFPQSWSWTYELISECK